MTMNTRESKLLELAEFRKMQRQRENRLHAGAIWSNPLDLVFTDEMGNSIPHATVEHRFTRVMEQMDASHRFHDLRHTFACECIRAGIDVKTVSETLGHYSAAFTLDVYAHSTEDMQATAAEKLQALISARR